MSDVSTDSQIEFEIDINSHDNDMQDAGQDAISNGEWADQDVGPPTPPQAVATVATAGAPIDHGYAAPMPGTVHTVVAELHAPPRLIAGAEPTLSLIHI